MNIQNKVILGLIGNGNSPQIPQELKKWDIVDFSNSESYFFSFFALLKKTLPHLNLEIIVAEFTNKYKKIQVNYQLPQAPFENKAQDSSSIFKKWAVVTAICLLFILLGVFSAFYYLQKNHDIPIFRSDLLIPGESAFLNRRELIAQINNAFKTNHDIQTVALVGIGGAGKTTMARQYAQQQKANVVWEFNAETKESLRASFENLAYRLALTDADKTILKDFQRITHATKREENITVFVKERLRNYKNWIFIYNDANNLVDIQSYFPSDPNVWGVGKVIITTRNLNIQNNGQISNFIRVGELTHQEKTDLFIKIMNQGSGVPLSAAQQEQATDFLQSIPPFPLDVSVAAHYLKSTHIPYQRYLEHLHTQENDFIAMQENILKDSGEYNETRYGIITLSLKHIIKIKKDFIDFLFFTSLLNSQNIPRKLISMYARDTIIDDFIYNLNKHSFLTNNKNCFFFINANEMFSIHESTQQIILLYLKKFILENNKKLIEKFSITLSNYIENSRKEENIQEITNSINHCKTFLSHENLLCDSTRGILEANLGNIYFFLGSYDKSKKFFEKSLQHLSKDYKKNYNFLAETLINFGKMEGILGQYEEAKKLIEQGLKIYNDQSPHNYSKLAWAYANLGSVYNFQGNYEKGKKLLEKSLLMYKAHAPKERAAVAWTAVELAMSYRNLGHYKEAKILLEESLQLFKKYSPAHYIKIALTSIYMGIVEKEMANDTKAKPLIEAGLSILKKYLPENHPDIAWTLIHLGAIHRIQGNYKEAGKLINQGLKVSKSHFSENHPMIAWEYTQLANVYRELKNYEEAKKLLNSAMRIYERLFGNESIVIARTYRNLGKVYLHEGVWEESEKLFRRALEIFQKANHSEQEMVLELLSDLMVEKSTQAKNQGNMRTHQVFRKEATEYLKQALDIMNTYYPEDSPHKVRITSKLVMLDKN